MKENNFVSAVVCLNNGAGNVYDFLTMANAVFKSNFKNWEFICVGGECRKSCIFESDYCFIREYRRI